MWCSTMQHCRSRVYYFPPRKVSKPLVTLDKWKGTFQEREWYSLDLTVERKIDKDATTRRVFGFVRERERERAHLLNIVFRQCLRRNIHSILLHILAHIGILNNCLPLFRHLLLLLCCIIIYGRSDLMLQSQMKIIRRTLFAI